MPSFSAFSTVRSITLVQFHCKRLKLLEHLVVHDDCRLSGSVAIYGLHHHVLLNMTRPCLWVQSFAFVANRPCNWCIGRNADSDSIAVQKVALGGLEYLLTAANAAEKARPQVVLIQHWSVSFLMKSKWSFSFNNLSITWADHESVVQAMILPSGSR